MKIIAPLLVILLLAGGWFYYSKNNESDIVNVPEVTETIVEGIEKTADAIEYHNHSHDGRTHDNHSHDHEEDDHTHDHKHQATSNEALLGEEGTITKLPVNPLIGIRGVGDPNAPIKITEFFSLTCNHCATFHTGPYQELKAKYIDTGKVYFVYEEFPLNGPALYGSMIARCLPEERYAGFIDILLRTQEIWAFSGNFKESLRQNAKLAGMSDEEFDTCFENKELQNALAQNIAAATDAWQISSTPSFIINDGERIIRGAKSMKAFDAIVEYYDNKDAAPDMPSASEAQK